MKKWFRQAFCRHSFVDLPDAVSGYGYTEYRIWFCTKCDKLFWKQTQEQQ